MSRIPAISLAAAVLLTGAALQPAAAKEVVFLDPDGPGGAADAIAVAGLQWRPGNAVAVDALPIGMPDAPSAFTTFYQSSLAAFLDPAGSPIGGTGLGSLYEITVQAAIPETGAQVDASTILFGHDDTNPENFFRIFFDSTPDADPVSGRGFADDIVILEGTFRGNDTFFSFEFDSAPLDSAGGTDGQEGFGSVIGRGSGPIYGDVDRVDPAFFVGETIERFVLDTLQTAPFTLVEPTGPTFAGEADGIVGNFPEFSGNLPPLEEFFPNGVNGLPPGCDLQTPCDVMLQSEVVTRFGPVPEPGGLALGAGLVALGCALARRRLAGA